MVVGGPCESSVLETISAVRVGGHPERSVRAPASRALALLNLLWSYLWLGRVRKGKMLLVGTVRCGGTPGEGWDSGEAGRGGAGG